MSEISNLTPKGIWEIFEQITKVPRPSKKEGKIIKFLEEFAAKHSLEYKKDAIGNIMIKRPAAASMKDRPTIVLQSHMDMVCEKNSDVKIDFEKDPIQAYVDGQWVKAKGTTLGADDGIGMAAALAIVTDQSLELPAIEALFTVDEETGLTGAFNLGSDMLTGKYLINLDSEDEGEIFIGCAGGVDTLATFTYKSEPAPADYAFFKIAISGLKGGHSGDDIDKGLGNSNKLLNRFIWHGTHELELRLSEFNGGNLRNAIPREAFAIFGIPTGNVKKFMELYERLAAEIHEEYGITEPGLDIAISEEKPAAAIMDFATQARLTDVLQGLPNGVLAMSFAMPGLVETSTNLASVKFEGGDKVVVTTSQRSSVDGARFNAADSIASVFELGGAKVVHSDGYPGWNPNPHSHLLEVTRASYQRLFGNEPKVRAIHAGLECGLFLQRYPHLEMVSIGPTLRGVHSPDERLEISTVDKFWKLLIDTLINI
jgi:dipeptidase D